MEKLQINKGIGSSVQFGNLTYPYTHWVLYSYGCNALLSAMVYKLWEQTLFSAGLFLCLSSISTLVLIRCSKKYGPTYWARTRHYKKLPRYVVQQKALHHIVPPNPIYREKFKNIKS